MMLSWIRVLFLQGLNSWNCSESAGLASQENRTQIHWNSLGMLRGAVVGFSRLSATKRIDPLMEGLTKEGEFTERLYRNRSR